MPSNKEPNQTSWILKQVTLSLNSKFSFSKTSCLNNTIELGLPYYLPKVRERKDEFMPFLGAFASSETQTAPSKIWTQFIKSIPTMITVIPQEYQIYKLQNMSTYVEYSWFEFSVFLLRDWLPHHG